MMKGKKLTSKILLAVLLAAPYGVASADDISTPVNNDITGTSETAFVYNGDSTLTVNNGKTIKTAASLTVNNSLMNYGTITEIGSLKVTNDLTNSIYTSTISVGELDVTGDIVNSKNITVTGTAKFNNLDNWSTGLNERQNKTQYPWHKGEFSANVIDAQGYIRNDKGGIITVGESMTAVDDITNDGTIKAINASVRTQAALTNSTNGTLTAKSVEAQSITNQGNLTADTITATGTISNSNEITVKKSMTADGNITNSGNIKATDASVSTNAVFTNNSTGTVEAESFAASTKVHNYGKITADTVNDIQDLINYADAEITVAKKMSTNGKITNNGKITAENAAIENVTDLANYGTMEAASISANKVTNTTGANLTVHGNVDSDFSNSGTATIDGTLTLLGNTSSSLAGENGSIKANKVITKASTSIKGTANIGTLEVNNASTIVETNGKKVEFETIDVNFAIQFRDESGEIQLNKVNLNNEGSYLQSGLTKMSIKELNANDDTILETWSWSGDNNDAAIEVETVNVKKGKLNITNNAGEGSSFTAEAINLAKGTTLANAGRQRKNGSWTNAVDDFAVKTLTATNASIYNEGTMTIGTMKGSGNTFYVESLTPPAQVSIEKNESTGLTVSGSGDLTDFFGDNITAGMQSLADTISITNGNKQKMLKAAAGTVTGEITARTDENGNIISVREGVNAANAGISEMASIALMGWRAENNDMNKRLGELRDSKGEHGVWARMVRGEGKYKDIKNQYNTYQLGYDEKLSTNDKWTVGGAVTYTDGESSFNLGRAENKHTGFALYGSYLNDDGSFIDLIAKYARLEHEFDVMGGAGKGDYNTNGYSVSAEYGKRFTQDNGLWIEPQVELTYGKVGSVNYVTSKDVNVRQDGLESLVGRLGFALGKDFKQGNAYVRASYLYDFDGETDVYLSKNGAQRSFEQDLGGGWWEVGVGANINLSDATHLYFDVEKTYGGNVATPWQWNLGVRYSF